MAMNNAQENDGPFYFFLWCVATHASWADLSEDLADTQPNSRAEEAWQVIWQPRVHSRHCLAGCWADMGAQLPWDLDRSPLSEAGEMEQALRLPQGPTPRSWCVCVWGGRSSDISVLLAGIGKCLGFPASCCLPFSRSLWDVLLYGRKAASQNQVSQTSQPPHKEGLEHGRPFPSHLCRGGTPALEDPALPVPPSFYLLS